MTEDPIIRDRRRATEVRRLKVAEWLLAGWSYRRMRENLDPHPALATIGKDIRKILECWAKELCPEERRNWILRDLRKLSELERVLDDDLHSDNISRREAVLPLLLRIQQRRAKLLGLDAPIKTAFTDPTGEKDYGYIQAELTNKLLGFLGSDSREGQEPDAGEEETAT